jgi:putative zinc finger protein
MTSGQCSRGASFADLIDYWVGDLNEADAERVEAHVFECRECADRLGDVQKLAAAIGETVRGARIHSIVTDGILNKFARDGLRMRTFAAEAGKFIPCAIWPEDDLIVSRLKGDFTGYDQLTVVLKVSEGPELSRDEDIPMAAGAREIITVASAAQLRKLPAIRLQILVSGTRNGVEQMIGDYGLEHGGTMNR